MSYSRDSLSKDWRPRTWKTANIFGRSLLISTAPTSPASSSSTQSTTTEVDVAAEVTNVAALSSDQITCLQNCRDAFRNSILPYDRDFDKICAVIANQKDDALFEDLYSCDEGCGFVVNDGGGVGQDSKFR